MHEAGLGHREIVRRTCRGWQEEQLQTRRRGTERPRSTQERGEDRLLRRRAIQDPWEPSRSVGINWIRAIGHRVSMSTIHRRIRSFGLGSYRSNSRFPLTPHHKIIKLQWCQARQHWLREWNDIIFSDESRFYLWHSDGRTRVRRPRGEGYNLQFVRRRHTGLTPVVMVWGGTFMGDRYFLTSI
ncbi:HTH Tnp Tc3 2 domain containing protein [Asbolus verrucosus]|uniref:HTH Tnp Tc3 2 domain containing protein n=1 Tax=Asbolus verrucosus TaxID=1661398 RepID=A0A482VGW4_ASBVE|nr:HTH Tnp Tc3 2 domain containing protein [Asbolus verrucosus]